MLKQHTLDLSAFVAQTWLIDPVVGESLLAQALAGQLVLTLDETPVHYTDFSWAYYSPASKPNSIAVITIQGVIYDYYAQYICDKLSQIYADKNVVGLVAKINSPGGSANAGYRMADGLANAPIPTWAHVEYGQAASAGYMIGCACDGMSASRPGDRIGSIGTYVSYQNLTKYFEKLGIESRDIYAKQSTEKNLEGREAAKGNFKPLENYVTQEAQSFIDYVNDRRSDLKTDAMDPFKGKIFSATDALTIGLIDHIGPLKDAIAAVSKSSIKTNTTPRTTMIFGYVKAAALMALAGVDAASLTEDQLKAANEELTGLGIAGAQLVSQAEFDQLVAAANKPVDNAALTTANDKVSALTTQVTNLTTQLGTAQAEVSRLGALNGAEKTVVKTTTETQADAGEGDESATLIANLPHNKALEGTWFADLGKKEN